MPAFWSRKDERQYGHIVASCKKRGKYGAKRCRSIAAATVNKTRSKRRSTSLSGLGATLPGRLRRDFCLPGPTRSSSKYPVPTCSHANNALGRARGALNKGYLTKAEFRKVTRCARRAQKRLCR